MNVKIINILQCVYKKDASLLVWDGDKHGFRDVDYPTYLTVNGINRNIEFVYSRFYSKTDAAEVGKELRRTYSYVSMSTVDGLYLYLDILGEKT